MLTPPWNLTLPLSCVEVHVCSALTFGFYLWSFDFKYTVSITFHEGKIIILKYINENTFSSSEFSNFTIFDEIFLKLFLEGKLIKTSAGLKLLTNRLVVNNLTLCATLLGSRKKI